MKYILGIDFTPKGWMTHPSGKRFELLHCLLNKTTVCVGPGETRQTAIARSRAVWAGKSVGAIKENANAKNL